MRNINQALVAFLGLWMCSVCVLGISNPTTVYAETRTVEADGYYIMGDGPEENMVIAKERARTDALRVASEMAGIYVESISSINMGQLTRDEVRTIAANVLEVQKDDVDMETISSMVIRFHCHVVAKVNIDTITAQIHKDKETLDEAVRKNRELEQNLKSVNMELARIKKDYQKATDVEKRLLTDEIKENERKFCSLDWNEKGNQYYFQGEFEKAITCYNKSIEYNPKNSSPWDNIGATYNKLNRPQEALTYLHKAIELNPKSAYAWNNLGYSYLEMKQFNQSVKCLKEALKIDPNFLRAWDNLCRVYINLNRCDIAIECGLTAVGMGATDAMAWNNLGTAYRRMAWNNLGTAYRKSELYQNAIDCFRKTIELAPNIPSPLNNLGCVYYELGRYEEAIYAFKKALELDPGNKLYLENYRLASEKL